MSEILQTLQGIRKTGRKLDKMSSELEEYINMRENVYYDEIVSRTFDLSRQGEKLAEMTRSLPVFTGYPKCKEELTRIFSEEIGIQVSLEEKCILHIHMNALLPKKEKERSSYIRAPLHYVFEKYTQENSFDIIRDEVVITFIHNYNRDEREWRDHDNVEINVVVDAIALFFLEDDTSKKCSHFYTARRGTEDSTDIYIVPKRIFPDWLKTFLSKEVAS